jgi:hypothetical protein
MKINGHQIEEATYRMGENICQLYNWPGINNQNIQWSQRTKLPKNQWPNEKMGTWTVQRLFKGRLPNG